MSRIQSNIGLITGIPIQETVNQLMSIAARPRDRLVQRTALLSQEQVAITELTALVIGIQFSARQLSNSSVFTTRKVETSPSSILSATLTGKPAAGVYEYTPLRQAQTHQLLSGGFASDQEPVGSGTLLLRRGGFVDSAVNLADLNGGGGVQRGSIRITDRSGESAVVDLSQAVTLDDVLAAINGQQDAQVTATTRGDALHLIDHSGGEGNLRVQEVGVGRTAADLGLAGLSVAADSATGGDVLRLYNGLQLDRLRDAAGVRIRPGVPDLSITLADGGPPLEIDFNTLQKEATPASATTSAKNGVNAQVVVTSVGTGAEFDDIRIRFVNDSFVEPGKEKVIYDASDANNKTLTVRIAAGASRAIDAVRAINNDPTVGALFNGSLAEGGNGTGILHTSDTGLTAGGAEVRKSDATLGQLLATINAADPARLQARLSAGGDRLELIDLTSGGGTFSATSPLDGSLAAELGLTGAAVDGVISGKRLLGGLRSTLLTSLGGGAGLGALGQVELTDRSGASATVDLASAETLDEVAVAINQAGLGLAASVNATRDGLLLRDTTGETASNLIVANGADGLQTAAKLGIAFNDAATEVDSGNLGKQIVSRQSLLAEYREGKGVQLGSFLLTDSKGASAAVNLKVSGAKTLGDVIDAVNALSIGVEARINTTGDGLLLVDTAGGGGTLRVADVGNGTAAADLGIAGTASETVLNGSPAQVLDGATTFRVEIEEGDTLAEIVKKINDLEAGVTASVINDGAGVNSFRLSLVSAHSGKGGELFVDSRLAPFAFEQVVAAQDALVRLGGGTAGGVLVTSASNSFTDLLPGATLTVGAVSDKPVKVTVTNDAAPVVSRVKAFVEQYNKLRAKLKETRVFDESKNTVGPLFGSSEALRVETSLGNLVTGRVFGAGPIQTLAEVGVNVRDDGTLELDETKLRDKYAADPDAVDRFFTTPDLGISARLDSAVEALAGVGNTVLIGRSLTLQARIDDNNERVEFLTARLDRERTRLLNQFFQLESIIANLQTNLDAVASIQALPSLIALR